MHLGQISLNLSFSIYMFLYLPQLIHNQKQTTLNGLSIWMHTILYLAYAFDLIYGFGTNLPWQYRTISGVGWLLLSIQHFQFMSHFKQRQQKVFETFFYILLPCMVILVACSAYLKPFSHLSIQCIGYLAQMGFVIAFLPQILKSKQLQSSQSINVIYILLNALLAALDIISAWQLHWGWPNKLGALLNLLFTGILLIQYKKYKIRPILV